MTRGLPGSRKSASVGHRPTQDPGLNRSSYARLRSRLWLRRNLNPLVERGSRLLAPTAWLQGREIVYQNLVHRELDRLQISEPFYPLRSAATYSYLYLLLRAAQELGGLRILELGAGQSTVLLDRLAERWPLHCTTLEHDEHWVAQVRRRVSQTVLHAPLLRRTIRGQAGDVYDPSVLAPGQRFNVLLVDGPRSSRRRSRWGSLEFIENWLEPEFLILFDDAERRGELQTIGAALRLLDERDCRYGTQLTRSINSQFLVATEGFERALYF
jgi:predicted O-methyltransferase YrrM